VGDFFNSPRERAAESLYENAIAGRPIGESFLRSEAAISKQKLRQQTSGHVAGISGDIMSRLASIGVSPGSSTEAVISKSTSPILAGEQIAESGIDENLMRMLTQSLLQELQLGFSGLSSSSTFGNILAGLQTAGNIASGGIKLAKDIGYNPGQTLYDSSQGIYTRKNPGF